VLAITRFDGIVPTDPPTGGVLVLRSYTYLVDDDGGMVEFPSWSEPLRMDVTGDDLATAGAASAVAEAAAQGYTLTPADIVTATTYVR
jgi:hypothetical protein